MCKSALASVNNRVDGILFVINDDCVNRTLVDLFRVFQEDVFHGKMANNTMLVCSKCSKGWLQKNRENIADLNELINRCNNHSHEFKLRFDTFNALETADQETKRIVLANYEEDRNQAIRELLNFIDSVSLASVDLSHVQNSLGFTNMIKFPLKSVVMTGTATAAAAAGGGTADIGASAAATGSLTLDAASAGVGTGAAAAIPALAVAGLATLGAIRAVASNPAAKVALAAFVSVFKSGAFL